MTKDASKEIEKLTEKIKELEETIEYERKEKDRIVENFEKVKKEFEEFKEKHSIAVTNLRRAMNIKANSRNVSKPLGAPKGHAAYNRRIRERIDHVKELIPKECGDCNKKLTGKTIEVRYRFVTRLKLVLRAETTRYDIHRKRCKKCKKIIEKDVPNVLPHCQFDLNIMLLVMYLKLGLRLSCTRVCEYFLTIHDLKMCPSTVTHTLKLLANEFGDYYSYLEKLVKFARVKHTDSTSWRIKGNNYFLWVFIAYGIVLYKIRKRNNSKSALTVFGTNNISERELRELVIQRDITHGSGSQRGAHAMAMLISIIQTLKLSKKNVLQGLQQIINSRSGC